MNSISIIIPAYNAAATLPAAIDSCLQQLIAPCDIIVVNDGSTDETAAVAASFGESIHYLSLENGGVSHARNEGVRLARGEWLLFLDADDELLPQATALLQKKGEEQSVGVVYGMVLERREPPQQARLNGFDYAAGMPPCGAERIFWRNAIITPGSALVRASLHQKIGGFVTGYEPMEDRDYWIKCGLLEPIAFCDTVVLDKKWHPGSHGSQESKRIYRGQLAQRALKTWAQERNIPIDWMPHDQEIVRSALDEAIWRRRYEILKPLLQEAKAVGCSHWKAALLAAFFAQRAPEWIG